MRNRRPSRLCFGLVLAAGAGGCDSPVGQGHDTAVELTAEPATALIDQQVTFRYEARGRNLAGVVIAFGDGSADSIPAFAAQTAGGNRTHRYQAAGTFVATAEAVEATGEKASAEISIVITTPSDG